MPSLLPPWESRFGVLCWFETILHVCGRALVTQLIVFVALWMSIAMQLDLHWIKHLFWIVPLLSCASSRHTAFLCLFLFGLPSVHATCLVCFGSAVGCKGEDGNCPWVKDTVANVAVIAAATGGALKVASLLTPRLLRVFTKPVLETLSMIVARPKDGQSFDMTGKTTTQISQAVRARCPA